MLKWHLAIVKCIVRFFNNDCRKWLIPFPYVVLLSKGNNVLVVNRIEIVIMKMKATYQLFLFSNMTILEYADLNNR